MTFFPSFRRKSSFAAYALGPSWLTIFLLSSRLCFLASSYTIDASCRNYKGHDISGDIKQAVNEVVEMVINAQARISRGDSSTIHLLESLFGRDPARYHTVSGYFARFARRDPSRGFDVICDDLMVNIGPDPSPGPMRDPRGRWVDRIHGWALPFDGYRPCDPLRKPGSAAGTRVKAFVIEDRYIYLCPIALDLPKGRSLAPYKDQVLAGKRIDDYTLTPVLLFHELLHSPLLLPDLRVEAYGFTRCRQLAYESPDLAVQNADSVALCALGKLDSNLAKQHQKEENLLIRLDSRSLLA
ncbi:hypothetical protein MMC22_010927 [Lobaria immixta]|nr:hypothetical protein [Lobaria immixta]